MDPERAAALTDREYKEALDYHSGYREYNGNLRTWFVAFGIGGPVLLLTNETLLKKLAEEGRLVVVSLLFIIGAGSQIVIAFINKLATYYGYRTYSDVLFRNSKWGRFWSRLDRAFLLDILCDLVSMTTFGWAVWMLFLTYL